MSTLAEGIVVGAFTGMVFVGVVEIVGWAFAPNKKPERLTFEQRIAQESKNASNRS